MPHKQASRKSRLYKNSWDTFSVGRELLRENRGELNKWLQRINSKDGGSWGRRQGGGVTGEMGEGERGDTGEKRWIDGGNEAEETEAATKEMITAWSWWLWSAEAAVCWAHLCDHIFHICRLSNTIVYLLFKNYNVWWKRKHLLIILECKNITAVTAQH